jgi:transposase
MRARHRLSRLLLRHGMVYDGGRAGTNAHDLCLRREALPALTSPATRLAFDSNYEAVLAVKARRDRLDTAIEEMAADSQFTPVVRRLLEEPSSGATQHDVIVERQAGTGP